MPQKIFIADAVSVVTVSLVAILALFGFFCIIYTLHFRSRIRSESLIQHTYFTGPWIIRITYVFFILWCSIGEILRLRLFSRHYRILKWKENTCRYYIVSNIGFSEPCLFLTLVFLLRASLQRPGALAQKWNLKTFVFILLNSLPMLAFQFVVILIAPIYKDDLFPKLPSYFIKAAAFSNTNDTLCTYPLFSIISLGLFATLVSSYLFYLGRKILHLVINNGLRKRVLTLIFSISGFFPLRVLLLGLSVLIKPENIAYDAVVFLSFLPLLCCSSLGIYTLVYLPVSDSLSWMGQTQTRDVEEGNDTSSLITENSGSISFHVKGRNEDCEEGFVELSLFSQTTPIGSPRGLGWPMIPLPSRVEET